MTRIVILCSLILNALNILGQSGHSAAVDNSRPFVLGVIQEIPSQILNESRILNIYLPPGYDASDTISYPVIYLLDGSADEDFIHVVGLVQFNTFEWVNRMPRSIVVGIASVDRKRDFTFPSAMASDKELLPTSGHSDRFISFIEKELQPYIQKKYRTNSSRTIIGQSLGGLLATEILLKKPALFTRYIIISPSLWWDNGSLLEQSAALIRLHPSGPLDVYIGVGKEGLTPAIDPHVMEVDANVLADTIGEVMGEKVNLYFDYLPAENHATIMHQALTNAFIFFNSSPNKQ